MDRLLYTVIDFQYENSTERWLVAGAPERTTPSRVAQVALG
jgi:hypothetical protein